MSHLEASPADLYQAIEERRAALGWPLWRVGVRVDADATSLTAMHHGVLSKRLRERVTAWLAEETP